NFQRAYPPAATYDPGGPCVERPRTTGPAHPSLRRHRHRQPRAACDGERGDESDLGVDVLFDSMVNMDEQTSHRRLRESRATRASVAGVAFQGVYAIGQFVVMALLVRHLDPQRFGMWLMIYPLTAWMGFSKFG